MVHDISIAEVLNAIFFFTFIGITSYNYKITACNYNQLLGTSFSLMFALINIHALLLLSESVSSFSQFQQRTAELLKRYSCLTQDIYSFLTFTFTCSVAVSDV